MISSKAAKNIIQKKQLNVERAYLVKINFKITAKTSKALNRTQFEKYYCTQIYIIFVFDTHHNNNNIIHI